MQQKPYIAETCLLKYLKTVYITLFKPNKAFKDLTLNTYQLCLYLILSAFLYALIGNILNTFSPFVLLIIAPLLVIPHSFFLSCCIYTIFKSLTTPKLTFKNSFKISSYLLIATLPFMSIVFTETNDNFILIIIKILPFLYFAVLLYKISYLYASKLRQTRRVMLTTLVLLIIMFISTLVFTVNISLVQYLSKQLFGFEYVWRMNYL